MPDHSKTAVILVDPYNDFLHSKGKLNGLLAASLAHTGTIKHLKEVVDAARAAHIPIYYGLHQQYRPGFLSAWKHPTGSQSGQANSHAFEQGSWGAEIYAGLEPDLANNDVVFSHHWSSSNFQGTDLEYQLHQREITQVVCVGLTANTCLESTARYAYELGFHVTLVTDATAGFTIEATEAATKLIWPLFAHKVETTAEWIKSL